MKNNLETFNEKNLTRQQIAKASGVAWPTVYRYFNGGQVSPSITHIAAVLRGMGINWREVTLGELMEESPSNQ